MTHRAFYSRALVFQDLASTASLFPATDMIVNVTDVFFFVFGTVGDNVETVRFEDSVVAECFFAMFM